MPDNERQKNALKNIAYIDNQNLFMATRTAEEPWMIDMKRVLLPSRHNASSLYKQIPEANKAYLDTASMKAKIGRRHEKGGFA